LNRVGFILKPDKSEALQIIDQLLPWLLESEVTPVFLAEDQIGSPNSKIVPDSAFPHEIDICVVLGGDGTMLRASALVADEGVPVLGINLGRLGFLTPFKAGDAQAVLAQALQGNLKKSERMRLDIAFHPDDSDPVMLTALNDCVIHQGAMARMVELDARLEGELIASYRADGLIVATPTGSTAYNLAAGGPIMSPLHEAMAITPICAHSLTNRPLVVADKQTISITLGGDSRGVVITVDGRWAHTFNVSDRLEITTSARPLIIYESDKAFFDILREKLHWGARSDRDA
jgi:NAD+ kinase